MKTEHEFIQELAAAILEQGRDLIKNVDLAKTDYRLGQADAFFWVMNKLVERQKQLLEAIK